MCPRVRGGAPGGRGRAVAAVAAAALLALAGTAALAATGCGAPRAADGWAGASGTSAPPTPPAGFADTSPLAASPDGRSFVFSGRRSPGEPPAIWEIGPGGGTPRRLTSGNGRPADPDWLPDGNVVFSDASGADAGDFRSLFACAPDGTGLRRLTFSPARDGRPLVLPDGRIHFERRPAGAAPGEAALEMTVHPDGTGVAAYAGRPIDAAPPAGAHARAPVLTSVVRGDQRTGTLLCLDVYRSRLDALRSLPRGAVARVRVGLLGGRETAEAPVAADGSFFVEVPADRPLRLTLLDRDGRALASLESGLWVRPNENRACIGCHEDPRLAPENRQPLAVRDPPVPLSPSLVPAGGA